MAEINETSLMDLSSSEAAQRALTASGILASGSRKGASPTSAATVVLPSPHGSGGASEVRLDLEGHSMTVRLPPFTQHWDNEQRPIKGELFALAAKYLLEIPSAASAVVDLAVRGANAVVPSTHSTALLSREQAGIFSSSLTPIVPSSATA